MKRLFLLMLTIASLTVSAQNNNTNRGFIHPGGLHTQADFNRVKQQLANGNAKVVAAYQKLTNAAYSQSSVQTYPVEIVVRGGTGENYINAARGATMAYQNALRWKIAGTEDNAQAAVRILMAWCNTTQEVTGNSDQCLAIGLYGYQFAQAAELMRDYEGWSREDFLKFKQWMLSVWYPKAINFLRGRNGTWDNAGKWWQAPGHYWSNWGLCNILCVISIGILCDDVYIYNQGMSFFKYDQVGNYANPHTLYTVTNHDYEGEAIWNDGLTDFLGNLVVTDVVSSLETGAYGRLGQMNESGRDTGHSALALGLAVDIAKVGWNQGDDLFAYMDHRLASGIEYVAAQTQSIENLPWTPYLYGNNGYYYSDYRSWLMLGPALGAQTRPYWGTVIGIYEGVKGVRMPYSEVSYNEMGIDEGGSGSTSGGYDHLGYSVLMNTYDTQLAPAASVPTELSPRMQYSGLLDGLIPSLNMETTIGNVLGKTINHNELGGLINNFATTDSTCVPNGQTIRLMPQLPAGETDTGLWQWNTGETTREITITTNKSFIYRVTYTNSRGVKSQLCFPIATVADIEDGEEPEEDNIEGTYYLYNPSSGYFLSAGDSWGTKAVLGETGVDLIITSTTGGYTLNSRIKNSETDMYLSSDLYLDNVFTPWTIEAMGTIDGKESYTLTSDGVNYMAAPSSGIVLTTTTSKSDEKAQWIFLTHDDLLEKMTSATPSNPVNATFLLPGYNFGRNDTRNNYWLGGPVIRGDVTNMNGEKYNTTFDVYQILTDIPNGFYEISLQGYYRDGNYDEAAVLRQNGTEVCNAFFYAQNDSIALPSIFEEAGNLGTRGVNTAFGYVPDSQSDASAYLSAGLYKTGPLRVQVTDGMLRLGIRKNIAVERDWTLFDNFCLIYCGNILLGDVTNDGNLDNADVVALADILVGKDSTIPYRYNHDVADVNNDGYLSLADVTALVNLVTRRNK